MTLDCKMHQNDGQSRVISLRRVAADNAHGSFIFLVSALPHPVSLPGKDRGFSYGEPPLTMRTVALHFSLVPCPTRYRYPSVGGGALDAPLLTARTIVLSYSLLPFLVRFGTGVRKGIFIPRRGIRMIRILRRACGLLRMTVQWGKPVLLPVILSGVKRSRRIR